MRILVYGAGAIGMTCGGFLSARHDVSLLGRPRHLRVIRKEGLQITGIWGRHRFDSCKLYASTDKIPSDKPFDLILVCVKSYDTETAARDLLKFLSPRTIVLALQNGLGNVEILKKHLKAKQILAARVIFGAEILSPGKVHITVMAAPIAMGEPDRGLVSGRVRRVVKIFKEAGIPAQATADIESLLWAKVTYNSALNPLASLLNSHYGFLGENEITRELMDAVVYEVYAVGEKCGVRLNPSTSKGFLRKFYKQLLPDTYDHHPSMLQDLRAGKKTEIDSLNGAVARFGKSLGVATPVNDFLVRMIHEKEKV